MVHVDTTICMVHVNATICMFHVNTTICMVHVIAAICMLHVDIRTINCNLSPHPLSVFYRVFVWVVGGIIVGLEVLYCECEDSIFKCYEYELRKN